jgi:hypothetical protein
LCGWLLAEISSPKQGTDDDHRGHRQHPRDEQTAIGGWPEYDGDNRGGERTHREDRKALAIEGPNLFGLDGCIGRRRHVVHHC